jgi:hypothetical protein
VPETKRRRGAGLSAGLNRAKSVPRDDRTTPTIVDAEQTRHTAKQKAGAGPAFVQLDRICFESADRVIGMSQPRSVNQPQKIKKAGATPAFSLMR